MQINGAQCSIQSMGTRSLKNNDQKTVSFSCIDKIHRFTEDLNKIKMKFHINI